MVLAAHAHSRDRIQQMRALPPLVMDEDRRQLQIRCADAEEKAENLRMEPQALQGPDDAEGRADKLQKELEDLQEAYKRKQIGKLGSKGECCHQAGKRKTSTGELQGNA
jgi:hypothetical protein